MYHHVLYYWTLRLCWRRLRKSRSQSRPHHDQGALPSHTVHAIIHNSEVSTHYNVSVPMSHQLITEGRMRRITSSSADGTDATLSYGVSCFVAHHRPTTHGPPLTYLFSFSGIHLRTRVPLLSWNRPRVLPQLLLWRFHRQTVHLLCLLQRGRLPRDVWCLSCPCRRGE